MSYLVLARKYRPRTFADVVGQEVATNTLRGAIAEGRIGHAYLFTGPRGTGKTTSARIFAKALECERGPSIDPCGECERCHAADAGAEADIVEIDAASHTGVDHVRELREQAAYSPLRARFKIFIIDEVHMLSKSAFNALLKTLEEPPPHVKFLFATTELGKVPETITSRCQIVKLTPISEAEIVARLEHVFTLENVHAEPGVAAEIARRARGGLRDALSLTDQLLSLAGTSPKLADVERLSGEGGADELEAVCDALEANDAARVLALLPPARGGEIDLVASLLEHVRSTLVVGLCGVDNPFVEADPPLRTRMLARAQRLGADRLSLWMEELLAARERMRFVPVHARVVLETALLALARPETSWSMSELAERLAALEARIAGAPTTSAQRPSFTAPHAPSTVNPLSAPSPTIPRNTPGNTSISPAEVLDASRSSSPSDVRSERSARSAPATASAIPSNGASGGSGTNGARSTASPHSTVAPTGSAPSSARLPRALVNTQDAGEVWKAVTADLAASASSLAELLRSRGKLTEIDGARATIKFAKLEAEERVLLAEPRNKKACTQAFVRVLGREIEVVLGDAEPPARAPKDAFTTKVSDLFGGRIEDDG